MNALAIIQITAALLELSSKYIRIAGTNRELTPQETEAFRAKMKEIFDSPAWVITEDPK